MALSFTAWEHHRSHHVPQGDRLLPVIAASGPTGMTRQQIGNAIDLDRHLLDGLLAGMVSAGLLTLAWEGGVPVYRSTAGVTPARTPFPV